MGNVLAATIMEPPTANVLEEDKDHHLRSKLDFSQNPGTYEEMHRKCKDVFPMTFEGVKILINKGLSNHFQVSHTLSVGNLNPGYRFGATYVGSKQYSPYEAFPVFLGDMDINGNLNAQIIHQPHEQIRYKLISQIQNHKMVANQFSADFRTSDYTASVTLSPNISTKQLMSKDTSFLSSLTSGILVAQYLHNITPRFALGTELMYHRSPEASSGGASSFMMSPFGPMGGAAIPKHNAMLSLAARFTGSNYVASGSFGSAGLKASYWHDLDKYRNLNSSLLIHHTNPDSKHQSTDKIMLENAPPSNALSHVMDESSLAARTTSIQVGCEVETNPAFGESVAMLGYQISFRDLPAGGGGTEGSLTNPFGSAAQAGGLVPPGLATQPIVTFRAYLDTNGTLGATLEHKICPPLPLTLTLSGAFNHAKAASRLGIGLMLG